IIPFKARSIQKQREEANIISVSLKHERINTTGQGRLREHKITSKSSSLRDQSRMRPGIYDPPCRHHLLSPNSQNPNQHRLAEALEPASQNPINTVRLSGRWDTEKNSEQKVKNRVTGLLYRSTGIAHDL
ncbi:hypothetical protein KC19_VG097600, partial [Ceratodon purpureus]